MGSNGNKNVTNDGTGFQPSEPSLCANGCGFFGSASTNNLCPKCFNNQRVQDEQAVSTKSAMNKLVNKVMTSMSPSSSSLESPTVVVENVSTAVKDVEKTCKVSNRCFGCNKKVRVMGFKCKCGETFCGSHRYPETHDCEYDFKRIGKEALAKANPLVRADKIDRI